MSQDRMNFEENEESEEVKQEQKPFALKTLTIKELADFIQEISAATDILTSQAMRILLHQIFSLNTLLGLMESTVMGCISYMYSLMTLDPRVMHAPYSFGAASGMILYNTFNEVIHHRDRNITFLTANDLAKIRAVAEKLNIDLANQTILQLLANLENHKVECENSILARTVEQLKNNVIASELVYCTQHQNSRLHPFFSSTKVQEFLPVRDYLDEPPERKTKGRQR